MESTDQLYQELREHMDNQAVGFPATSSGVELRILKELFTPEQARLALNVTYQPQSSREIYEKVRPAGISPEKVTQLLNEMVRNGAITLREANGTEEYFTMPLLVGIVEMHAAKATPQFFADLGVYMNAEFGKTFAGTKVSQMRTIPVEKSITVEHHVAIYDDVREMIRSCDGPIVINRCLCREGAKFRGQPCQKTTRQETCMVFGDWAKLAVKAGAKPITKEEALEIMRQNEEDGLVLQPNNYRKIDFVCACCGCCCGILRMQKLLPAPAMRWTHNYYAVVDSISCTGCGLCLERCQVNALQMEEQSDRVVVHLDRCIGCGNCVVTCPSAALKLVKIAAETTPPEDVVALYQILAEKNQPVA